MGALLGADGVEISCFHHQRVASIGTGLTAAAWADDGTVEVLEAVDQTAFLLAVQWHPEDTAASDPANAALFAALVEAARVGAGCRGSVQLAADR
jgi:putative glutamine amidotransferase